MPDVKAELAALIDKSISDLMQVLHRIPGDAVIHPESGWRVQDVISHLIGWDVALLRTLAAHVVGGEYEVVADREAYNAQSAASRRALQAGQVIAEYALTRLQLKAAVLAMPDEKLAQPAHAPWDETAPAADLVKGLVWHDSHHWHEFEKVLAENP
jgi:hypothetical protein